MRAERPSRTARKIAEAILYLEVDPQGRRLLPPGAGQATLEVMRAAGYVRPWQERLLRRRRYRRMVDGLMDWMTPGHLTYIGLRKRFLDAETRAAIGAGARQVLVVGGGFDTLCQRLATEYPEVELVETDHPATHAAKRSAVEAIGAARSNLHLVGVDLAATDLGAVLGDLETWDRSAATVVVAEGVLEYVEEEAVRRLLRVVREHSSSTRLLFSYMLRDEGGHFIVGRWPRLAEWSVRLVGEPLRWGVRVGELPSFLAGEGFRYDDREAVYDLRARFLEPEGLAPLPIGDLELVAAADST